MSREYKAGDTLTVKIERIVPRGLGIAFAEGLTVFVALAAVGDTVEVRLMEVRGSTAFAEIEAVIEPGPERIEPPCPYFGVCGGCDFQQLSYAAQLRAKSEIIRDCLNRIAKYDHPGEIIVEPSPAEFGYRLRAQWHAEPENGKLGYYQRNSRDLVDIDRCLVISDELQRVMDSVRGELPDLPASGGRALQIDAAIGSDGTGSVYSAGVYSPPGEIEFEAAGERFTFSAGSFFQGNRFLVSKLVEMAIAGYEGQTALDLYCGVGLFALPLARKFGRVVGVEENGSAIHYARHNAKSAGLSNTEFHTSRVRDFLAGFNGEIDLALLDPPRAGTEKETMMRLIELRPRHVVYVACEPSILARDLKRFLENGYAIERIQALDLFPQTHHVETIVHLSSSA
ncbi:MAG TPA: class I SAM-dependent RNA methyltransferase [Pyrinomonadaceae bacterium]|nr:class I SAM-dependent RNA methyltransferase [Pyrinomonadaceae bacterium]